MLLYVQEKERVGKSWVVKTLEMKFAFFDRCKQLVIFASTECIAKNIRNSTMHTALRVNTCQSRNYIAKIKII